MRVKPLDLRQHEFRTAFRGFDPNEVTALLEEIADDYEQALRETERLQQEVAGMQSLLSEHRESERNLRNTLLTAQRMADEIRASAEQEARRIVKEAEGRSELLIHKATVQLDEVQGDIDGLKMKRRDVETALEGIIAAVCNTLDLVKEQEQRERDEKVLSRPRQSETGAFIERASDEEATTLTVDAEQPGLQATAAPSEPRAKSGRSRSSRRTPASSTDRGAHQPHPREGGGAESEGVREAVGV